MTGYILSILGIVVVGIFIDIIVPSGAINKYIRGIYSIFVVAVLLSPITKFLNKNHDFTVRYEEMQVNDNLLNYIFSMRAKTLETSIEKELNNEGFTNVDIILNYSIDNDELVYKSCIINLKNLVIITDKQHINKYEFIKDTVIKRTNLTYEELIIDE